MKIHRKFIYYLFILIIILTFVFFIVSKSEIKKIFKNPDKKTISILISAEKDHQPTAVNLIFIRKSDCNITVFRLNKNTYLQHNDNYINIFDLYNSSKKSCIKTLEKTYNKKIDFYINIKDNNFKGLINTLGGCIFFNEGESKSLPQGYIYLHGNNYRKYINSIENEIDREDISYSVWQNLFTHTSFFTNFNSIKPLAKELYNFLDTDISRIEWNHFSSFIHKNYPIIHISYIRNDLEVIQLKNNKYTNQISVPYLQGKWDIEKINETLNQESAEEKKYKLPKITVQVKNATDINRFAARTTGILRRKKCEVVEYGMLSFLSDYSVLIDRSGSPIKTEYLKKVTKISNVIYKTSYKKPFDITVILGEDYYAVKRERENEK